MSDTHKLKAESRKISGRKVKQLRREGIIPANVYGKDVKSLSIQIPVKDFKTAFAKVGETGILDLEINKEVKPRPVLVNSVQIHPVTDDILHVDFRQVDLTKKVAVSIPIEVTGESPAVTQGGVLIQLIHEVEVEALPRDLPDKFTLNVSKLESIGQGISLKDIKVDAAKVKLMAENLNELVVKIEEPTKEEIVAPPTPQPEAGQPVAEKGEAAPVAEGEKKPEEKPTTPPKAEKK